MKAWKELEEYIAKFLGWKRITKKHYGDSVPDLMGDGYIGDSKHYKRHRIHTIRRIACLLYKTDVLIFTKEKKTHYVPKNVLVTINLDQFNYLLHCKRIAEKVDNKNIKVVDNRLTNLLKNLSYRITIGKDILKAMEKIVKKIEEGETI